MALGAKVGRCIIAAVYGRLHVVRLSIVRKLQKLAEEVVVFIVLLNEILDIIRYDLASSVWGDGLHGELDRQQSLDQHPG